MYKSTKVQNEGDLEIVLKRRQATAFCSPQAVLAYLPIACHRPRCLARSLRTPIMLVGRLKRSAQHNSCPNELSHHTISGYPNKPSAHHRSTYLAVDPAYVADYCFCRDASGNSLYRATIVKGASVRCVRRGATSDSVGRRCYSVEVCGYPASIGRSRFDIEVVGKTCARSARLFVSCQIRVP